MDNQLKEVLEKSLNLFFKYGIKSVSMNDIAQNMGMSKKTLYVLFKNKEDLVKQVFDFEFVTTTERVNKETEAARDSVEFMWIMSNVFIDLFGTVSPVAFFDMKKYYHSIYDNHLSKVNYWLYELIYSNINVGIEEKVYRPCVDADIMAKIFISRSDFCENELLFPVDKYPKHILFSEYIEYHIRGIASVLGVELLEKYKSNKK